MYITTGTNLSTKAWVAYTVISHVVFNTCWFVFLHVSQRCAEWLQDVWSWCILLLFRLTKHMDTSHSSAPKRWESSGWVFISIQPPVKPELSKKEVVLFLPYLQQEKEGRKDADPQAEEVLIDETGEEPAVRDLSIFFNGFHIVFEFLIGWFHLKGQPIEIGLKLTAKKGHIGSAFGKMLQNIVEEPETGKESLNPCCEMSFYISCIHADHSDVCALIWQWNKAEIWICIQRQLQSDDSPQLQAQIFCLWI